MALWGGLGQAATVAQLVGADVGGLISMIMIAAATARQNKKECQQLARRVFMIASLLPYLPEAEVMRGLLDGLDGALREAHQLVVSCQGRSTAYRLVMAGRQAEKFREVQSRIDSYLLVFPFISHIDITRRLDRIYKVLLPNDATLPSPPLCSPTHEPEFAGDVAQEVVPHGEEGEKFTMAELAAATNNFGPDRLIGRGGVSNVYMGRLPDGREVAIKMFGTTSIEEFLAERTMLSHIRHKHIIRLFGCCLERERHKKRSRWFLKKKIVDVLEQVSEPPLLVFENMKNGSLYKHLHGSLSSFSPVTTSWSMRMEILLGVSRAIEYLHTHADRPVIHRDIKPSNILLDEAWVPRLSDFGLSLTWDEMECSDLTLCGTPGYCDPEYFATNTAKPTIDVYSFGVVMLEVLTGMKPIFRRKEKEEEKSVIDSEEDGGIPTSLASFMVPLIEAGKLWEVLDRRPTAEPTPKQLQAADLVAHTAARCLRFDWKERPAMSDVVANLQAALELVRADE
ncbi:hypothetical protein E2562_019743 [Oryza meyeriana var. granulata]|uniref:Protein kinase domain-containing protein n=1 Tax=Oryza meyeriana var. granulata TaxID=110450 RepID=A0A6G1C8A3_9ORYZ|nr:hypothetical protein E2562_019743 [Oryza meyeriana var. granulata]